ncbi:MAG: isoleucine--tRNA ligase [Candidatus Aenigmarchaeota archaeon]|nr:isoleucine--tRNA ligase [Candidatus Aenigmarchaeota archaeon]
MTYNPKEIEKHVQQLWHTKKVPQKIVKMDWKKQKFYLLDGPPYVNGVPHVGHAKTTIFKDVWGKFKFMQGYAVWFQPGFDCGGLPIENKVEKELGIKSKTEIEEKIGVDKFIEACQKFAKGNEPVWLNFYKQIGAWRGWLDPYLTSENYYLESGWWTVKKWFEKGLFVEGYRPGFWCPHCETVLAGIEASESYKNVEDPSIIVKFHVAGTNEYLLVFTTTPWTLPANAALAVHPEEMYVKVESENEELVLAEKRLEELDKLEKKYKVLEKIPGKKLAGLKYEPLLDTNSQKEIGKNENAHHVVLSIPVMKKRVASKAMIKGETESQEEFGHVVTMDVGTGIVHIAPGHGDSDNRLGKHYNLPEVSPVDEKGCLTEDAGKYAGMFVKKADPLIIEDLKNEGKLFHAGKLVHAYPLCWRCKTPLIYRMSRQWFLKLDILRDKIVKANKDVNWLPEFARERYHTVITEAPDWAVTRQRYWGIPLPIWSCGCGSKKVIGSSDELRRLATKKLPKTIDMHKNFVDKVKITCACGKEMTREKDIMDVWFDSGIAPWASLGYPFKNKELFENIWKVDLVDESQDQVRAWFNTLMICSFATFSEAPYKTVCLNGWTLDEKGEKMSKSLGNVTMAEDAYEKFGADLLRFYICYDVAPWDTQKFSFRNAEDLGRQLNILWNTYNYFKTYSKMSRKKTELRIEDKWLLSKINSLLVSTTNNLEKFNFHLAARDIMDFVVRDFSRTYIKIVRDRDDAGVDYVLTTVFEALSKIMSPLAPFISDYIYHDMTKKSVHWQKWPSPKEDQINSKLEYTMDITVQIVEAANAIRKEKGIKLRWPLKELYISGDKRIKTIYEDMQEILKKLCNVKDVVFGENFKLPNKNIEGFMVYLNIEMDEKLKEEATLRELLREIQEHRKQRNLVVKDKILLHLDNKKFEKYAKEIQEKVGAGEIQFGKIDKPFSVIDLEGEKIGFSFAKIK